MPGLRRGRCWFAWRPSGDLVFLLVNGGLKKLVVPASFGRRFSGFNRMPFCDSKPEMPLHCIKTNDSSAIKRDAEWVVCGCEAEAKYSGTKGKSPWLSRPDAVQKPLHGSPIEDYCMIGDCETAALVSREGSIDWLCWPNFSSGACFAAWLGTSDHGHWKIAPAGKIKAIRRQYGPHTLIAETIFETKDGEVELVDFMPPRAEHSHVVRMVRGVRGKVAMQMGFSIRFGLWKDDSTG